MIEIKEQSVVKEYERWLHIVGDDPYRADCAIGIHDVLRAHFLLVDFFFDERQGIGGAGPRDLNLLHSAVNRQLVSFGGKRKWTDKFDICATLFYGLNKNHPFHDCNKRTALLVALYHLQLIGRTPDAPQKDFENLTVRVAESDLKVYSDYKKFEKTDDPDVLFISHFFRRNTRELNKRNYIITYNQLNAILSKYDYRLANPSDNYIDVVKDEIKPGGLFRKEQVITKTIMRISFRGWKTEVGRATVKEVRRKTGLTERNGIDSDVFFRGSDPLEALISSYKGPLERLANK